MPWFNEIIVDSRAGFWNLAAALMVWRQINRGWDVIVDMQCSQRTNRYFSFFNHRETRWVGTAVGCTDPVPNFTDVNNQTRMIITARLAGGKDSVAKMEWLSKSKIAYPRELVDLNIGPYVVLAPGCSTAKPQKRWPAKRFAALANMFDKKDYTVILTGTEADRNAGEEGKSIAQNVIDFCQKTNLSDLCDLLYHADFVVGNDSGPVFLAAKAGVPTLMVMGPDTNPKMSAPIGAKASWLRANPIDLITEFEAFNEFRRLSRLKG